MSIFGTYGGRNGKEIAEREALIASIATETDVVKLARYITLDQFDYAYDPCGKSWWELNTDLTDMSRAAVRRLKVLFEGGE